MEPTSDSIRGRLADALPQALRERDAIAVAAIRSAIAAIENAAAVEPTQAAGTGSEYLAGSVAGLGAAEAPRRELSEPDLFAIVLAEATDREAEADDYRRIGQHQAADRLIAEAAYLREFTV